MIERYGGNSAVFFGRFGIDPAIAGRHDRFVSFASFTALLEHCAETLGRPHFGMDVCMNVTPAIFGPIAVLLESASTVGEAVKYFTKYFFTHSPQSMLSLREDLRHGVTELRFGCAVPSLAYRRQANEQGLVHIFKVVSLLLGHDLPLEYIGVAADPPASGHARLTSFFKCQILYEQPENVLGIPNAVLARPLPKKNPWLARLIVDQLDASSVDDGSALDEHIVRMIDSLLPLGQCNLNVCAEQLRRPPRTLQWQLRQLGTSFSNIVAQRRFALAEAYLTETRLKVSAIANILGYADQATFTRAFGQWSDASPGKYRRLRLRNKAGGMP